MPLRKSLTEHSLALAQPLLDGASSGLVLLPIPRITCM